MQTQHTHSAWGIPRGTANSVVLRPDLILWRLASWVRTKRRTLAAGRARRRAVDQLLQMSDRALNDIGIRRSDVERIAHFTHRD